MSKLTELLGTSGVGIVAGQKSEVVRKPLIVFFVAPAWCHDGHHYCSRSNKQTYSPASDADTELYRQMHASGQKQPLART